MSSPSEPDEIVSTSMERSFLPSFITEPLPNWRSIWDSAADSALLLSMDEPSTIRSAVVADIRWCSLWRGVARATNGWARPGRIGNTVPYLFSVRNMFFPGWWYPGHGGEVLGPPNLGLTWPIEPRFTPCVACDRVTPKVVQTKGGQ